MKIKRLLSLPFTFIADVVTLGNVGGHRSFTQQVFDAEQHEQHVKEQLDALRAMADLIKATRGE